MSTDNTIKDDGSKVSAIVRCKNEEAWIGHCIQSILDHINNPEIIVIDNNSTDESCDVVRMFQTFDDIKLFEIDDYSPGRAINSMVPKCSNEIILVISAHCVITKFDLDLVDNDLDEFVALFGKQEPIYRGRKISKRYIWSHFGEKPEINMISNIEHRYFFHNAFAIYRKPFLMEYPFNEKLYGKEDRYWARNIIDTGYKILYESRISCNHHWTANGATWKGIG